MRDLTKNVASLSWALSLYGARQLGRLFDPRADPRAPAPGASGSFAEVTTTLVDQLDAGLRQAFAAGDEVQRQILDTVFAFVPSLGSPGRAAGEVARRTASAVGAATSTAASAVGGAATAAARGMAQAGPTGGDDPDAGYRGLPIFAATSQAGETILVSYTRGTGTFSDDKRFIALSNTLFDLDGVENGRHEGVWQALFSSPAELLARPPAPTGTMSAPVGPVEAWPVSANTIAKWIHADGSSISSVGPAASHLIPLADGSFLFLVITAQIVTEGTGRFAGAHGLTQSLGATHVPVGVDLFAGDTTSFPAVTLDTFKLEVPPPPLARPGGPKGGPRPQAPGVAATAKTCAVTGDPRHSRFVEVLGSKMHVIDTGAPAAGAPAGDAAAPTVVFLHGDPTWSYLWRKVLPHVMPHARCIAPDLIGMGLSAKPPIAYTFADHVRYVDALLAELDLGDYYMVLHDWGCIIGLYHAMRHERRVRGVSFFEVMYRPYASWEVFPEALRPQFQAFRQPELGYQQIVLDNVFVEEVLPASTIVELSELEMNCYRMPFPDPASRQLIQMFVDQLPVGGDPPDVARAASDYWRWLRRTDIPKLLFWARPGLITTESDVRFLEGELKNLTTRFVGPGIHFLQESHPQEIGDGVVEWIRASSPVATTSGAATAADRKARTSGRKRRPQRRRKGDER